MRRRGSLYRRTAEAGAAGELESDTTPAPAAAGADSLQLPLDAPGAGTTESVRPEPSFAGLGPSAQARPAPALELAPTPVEARVQLTEYRRRVLANGADLPARLGLARLLSQRGELALALEQYEAARELAPEDASVVLKLAEALIGMRRFDPAERELRRVLKSQPENGAAYLQLGITSLRRGLYAQAEQELGRATALLPDSAAACFYRGEALNQLSRLDEALTMLERTVQLEPAHDRAYYTMGILYDKKNQPREAAALYRKAREVAGR